MGIQHTDQFDAATEKQVSLERFDFDFDLWAKAVKQQMLAALQNGSELTADDPDVEDLSDLLDDIDDESE